MKTLATTKKRDSKPKKKPAKKKAKGGAGKTVSKKKPSGKTRDKQKFFPGQAPKSYPDVEKAALTYEENRDDRLAALKEEIKLKQKLLDAMKKHDLTEYKFNGRKVFIETSEENVKVQKVKQPKPDKDAF